MDLNTRVGKIEYYLAVADTVSMRSTCMKTKYGAVIVKDDHIVSTGYNGAPRGRKNCCDIGECFRIKHNIPRGTRYETCRSVHSEANAIINAGRQQCIGAVLYLSGRNASTGELIKAASCCSMCKRMVINAGILYVIVADPDAPSGFTTYEVNRDWVCEDDSLIYLDETKRAY